MVTLPPPEGESEEWSAIREDLGSLVAAESVAVVGASNTPGKPGNVLLENIVDNEFDGVVYPVNPNEDTVLGLDAYPELADVPGDVDTVLFAVPGHIIGDLIPACVEKGVNSVVIVSAGFGEAVDPDRQRLEDDLRRTCEEHDLRAIGPNTTGMVSMKNGLVASFIPFPQWQDGPIGMAAQSGVFAGVFMEEVMAREVQRPGYKYSLALGNKVDIDETDFVRYAAQDDEVEVIQLHLESIRRPEEFFPTAAYVSRQKPIVLLKAGRTGQGREMARWHTASRPTVDAEVDAACDASGIVRARTVPEFMNYAKGFSYQPPPKGRKVAVLSFSGANAVMAADYIDESVLELAPLQAETRHRIKELVPAWQPIRNPVDLWLALPNGPDVAHEEPLLAVLEDETVDAVVVIHLASEATEFESIDEVYATAREAHPDKPIVAHFMGAGAKDRSLEALEGLDVPIYDSAYEAVDTLAQMYSWYRYTQGPGGYDPDVAEDGETI